MTIRLATAALAVLVTAAAAADRTQVRSIEFEGNETFSYRRLLGLMELQRSGLFRKGPFSRFVLGMDVMAVEEFYRGQGFIEASVSAHVERDPVRERGVNVRLVIREGKRVVVRTVSIGPNPVIGDEEAGYLRTEVGGPLVQADIAADVAAILDSLGSAGHLAADIRVEQTIDSARYRVDVRFVVAAGPCVIAGEKRVKGLESVRRVIVDRALTFDRGDTLTKEKIGAAERRLYRTGLFSFARVEPLLGDSVPRPAPPDTIVPVQITLDQADYFSLEGGIGYSSVELLRTSLRLSYANVLRLGHRATMEGSLSSIEQYAGVTYLVPWLPAVPLETEINAFYRRHDTLFFPVPLGYSGEFAGFTVGLGRTMGSGLSYTGRFRYENVMNLSAPSPEALPPGVPQKNTRSIRIGLAYDRRNDIHAPSRGYYGALSTELAGIFGASGNQFVKVETGARAYVAIGERVVVASGLTAGWVGPYGQAATVPPQEKFFAGGPRSVRGYEYHQVLTDAEGNPKGGNVRLVAHVLEIRFPLIGWFSGAVFLDAGSVWPDLESIDPGDLRYGAGPGLRIATPVGLIRFDLGVKLDRERSESRVEFYLDVGQAF